jgi:putative protease
MCKYKTYPNIEIEMITPLNEQIQETENELGKIYIKDGRPYIMFYKIITNTDKELESVHSGYTLPIKLPGFLPAFTMMRQKI